MMPFYLSFGSCMFVALFIGGSSSSASSTGDHDGISTDIITMPLIHRDQVVSRRMRELPEEAIDDVEESADENFFSDHRPSGQLYQGLGTHYVDLWVGTPLPQRQTLIVDTGSDLTAFPCEPCPDCGKGYHTDETYKDEESETFHLMDCDEGCQLGVCKFVDDDFSYCEVSLSYAEGSQWHAYEVTDQVYIGGPHDEALKRKHLHHLRRKRSLRHLEQDDENKDTEKKHGVVKSANVLEDFFKKEAHEAESKYKKLHPRANEYSFIMNFACQYKITGLFRTQLADGIMGMENSKHSFWMQMYEAGKIASKSFALCFSYSPEADRKGSQAGQLTLGGVDKRLHTSPMIYAENYDKTGWYSIYVTAIYLKYEKDDEDEPSIVKLDMSMKKFNSHGIILDSGTTESFLPSMMNDPFQEAFMKLMDVEFEESVQKESDIQNYPTILLQLKAARVVNDDELMDESGSPLEGLAGALDLEHTNDVVLEVTPENYMKYRKKNNVYSNAFHMSESSGFGVIGANVMSDHDILFDVENHRVGFAKSNCEYVD